MSSEESWDLLIECKGCQVENLFPDFHPRTALICNQCRELLVDDKLDETHNEFVCGDCGMKLLLLKGTVIDIGETTCQCGSSNITQMQAHTLPNAALVFEEKKDLEVLEDTDWLRSGTLDSPEDDDYNEMFDKDPGM